MNRSANSFECGTLGFIAYAFYSRCVEGVRMYTHTHTHYTIVNT